MIFNGKYKWFYFLLLDVNDFLGQPFIFHVEDNNVFTGFILDKNKLKKGSTKAYFANWLWRQTKKIKKD